MAEDVTDDVEVDTGLDAAAAAFTSYLNGPQEDAPAAPAPEAPVAAAPAPDPVPDAPAAAVAAAPQPVAQAPAPAAAPQAAAPVAPAQTDAPAIPAQLQPVVDMAKGMVATLQQRFMANFQDIKSSADLLNLMRTDPGRYNDFAVAKAELDQETAKIYETVDKVAKEIKKADDDREAQSAQARNATAQKIAELIPDLADPEKGRKLGNDMTAYARKMEVPADRYKGATAGEVAILHKAMMHDAREAADAAALEAANKKAAKAPQVQQPGTRQAGNGRDEKYQESFNRLEKSGRVDDAAAVFRQMFA